MRRHLERALEALAPDERDARRGHVPAPRHAIGDEDRARRRRPRALRPCGEDDVAGVLGHSCRSASSAPSQERRRARNGRYEIFHDVLAEGVLAWRSAFEAERELALERRRRRRAITVAAAALLALAAVTAVALFALFQRERAQDAARRANARGLAAQANSLMDVDPARSVALAARAARLEPSPDVERQLREAVIGSRVRAVFRARGGAVTDATLSPVAGRVAVGSAGGWIRVFDAATLRQLDEFRHPGRVADIEFSRDGKLLVSAGSDGTARLWRAVDGDPLRVFPHRGAVTSVSLSRDGRFLATGSRDRSGRVWNLSIGEQLRRLPLGSPCRSRGSARPVDRVAFVSGTGVRLFDPFSGRLVRSIDQPGAIAAIDFSRNGQLLATAGADRTARIWRLDPPGLLHELRRHSGRVTDVAFGPHRVLLATGSTDATGLVWNVARGTLRSNLLGHRGFVTSVRFSTDGDFVITASRDKTARVWTAKSGNVESVLAGHRGAVVRANFSLDGTRALTWSDDGTVRLRDPGIRPELRQIARHDGPVTSVSFDAGGDAMLAAGPGRDRPADGAVGELCERSRTAHRSSTQRSAPTPASSSPQAPTASPGSGRSAAARPTSCATAHHSKRSRFAPVGLRLRAATESYGSGAFPAGSSSRPSSTLRRCSTWPSIRPVGESRPPGRTRSGASGSTVASFMSSSATPTM